MTLHIYCKTHSKNGMVCITKDMCKEENCRISPHFNYEGEKKGIYCLTHKKDGMQNVIDKHCIENGCTLQRSFNYESKKVPLYCSNHALKGMIRTYAKYCKYDGCRIEPCFNYEGEKKALYCKSHSLKDMIDVCRTYCKTQLCYTTAIKKYDGYCFRCFVLLFPDMPNACNYKTKENATITYIKENFKEYDWVTDRTVLNGCSRRRPDLLLDFGDQVLIIEIDENQHTDYDCTCENKRLMELSQDVGHRPLVFIRFNPDAYKTSDKKVKSCWTVNSKGLCTINLKQIKDWESRLTALVDQIRYRSVHKTDKTIEIIQLFYDTV